MTERLTKDLINKGLDFTLTVEDFTQDGVLNEELYIEGLRRYSWFFIEQFQNVKDPGGTRLPVKLNKVQRYIERCKYEQLNYYNYVRLWILKPRQIGSSWYWARHGLHHSIWYNHICKIMAHAKDQTGIKSLFNYVYEGYKDLVKMSEEQDFLCPYLETSQCSKASGSIQFDGISDGSIEVCTSEVGAVGFASQHAHISEIPLIDNFPEFWNQYSQSLHEAYYHVVACEASAHHSDHFFLDKFDDLVKQWKTRKRPPAMRPVFIPCYMHEEYKDLQLPEWYDWNMFWAESDPKEYGDEREMVKKEWYDPLDNKSSKLPLSFWKWRREVIDKQETDGQGASIRRLDIFHQNFPMTYKEARITMGKGIFDKAHVMWHKKRILPPVYKGDIYVDEDTLKPVESTDTGIKPYRRWDVPHPGFEYFIGVDTSNERVGDKTVGIVFSPKQNAFVACLEFNEEETHIVVEHLIAMGMYWNNGMIGYESNLIHVGDTILKKLLGTDRASPVGSPYRNIYWERVKDVAYQTNNLNRKYGCQSSTKMKGIHANITRDFIRDKSADIWIPEYLNEVWDVEHIPNKDGKYTTAPAAPKNRNDDYYDAGALAIRICRDCEKRFELREQMKDNAPKDGMAQYRDAISKRRPRKSAEPARKNDRYAVRDTRSKRPAGRFSH